MLILLILFLIGILFICLSICLFSVKRDRYPSYEMGWGFGTIAYATNRQYLDQ